MIEQIKKEFGNWGNVNSISDFMETINKELNENNFKKVNSRLVFSVCPDDVNRIEEIETIEKALTKDYNGEFHLGGLGAYPMGGVSGLTAASHHPPDNINNGARNHGNLIIFISPHMGIIKNGKFIYGKIIRPGQERITSSCGAMIGFLDQLKQAKSPENFKIAPDDKNVDPTRIVLHQDLINNYSKELNDILAIENDENKQVLDLFKLNNKVVFNKGTQIINEFLEKEKEHFKGNIVAISGITINTPGQDFFVLKKISYPKK